GGALRGWCRIWSGTCRWSRASRALYTLDTPPCPTSSSTSYRPAIVSPTTDETLPGASAAYAPQARAQPQAAAPDDVEQQDEADAEPQRRARAPVTGAGGRRRDDPGEGEHGADDED